MPKSNAAPKPPPVLPNIAIKVWNQASGLYDGEGTEFRLGRVPVIGDHIFVKRLDGGGELTIVVTHVHHIPPGLGDTCAEVYGDPVDFETKLRRPLAPLRPVHIPGV